MQMEKQDKIKEDDILLKELLFDLRLEKKREKRIEIFKAFNEEKLETVEGRQRLKNIEHAIRIPGPASVLIRKVMGWLSVVFFFVSCFFTIMETDDIKLGIVITLWMLFLVLYIVFAISSIVAVKKSGYNPKLKKL